MADTLALPYLYDTVETAMATTQPTVTHHFGWREPGRLLDRPMRVVWVPGDAAGKVGDVVGARKDTRMTYTRPVASLRERFYVEITGYDTDEPENERLQYIATRTIFNAWWLAIHNAARGNITPLDINWLVAKNERRHGATLRVVCAILQPIPDAQPTVAPVDTVASVTSYIDDTADSPAQEIEAEP